MAVALQSIWKKLRVWSAWIADHELLPLSLGAALATFTTQWALWGLGLIAALWLLRWLGRGYLTVRVPVDWPVCVLLLMLPVTFFVTANRFLTLVAITRLLAGLSLIYGIANWTKHSRHVMLLAFGLAGVGLGLALIAPVSVGWFSNVKLFVIPARVYTLFPTLTSNTIHPNMIAGALVMLLPFPVVLLFLNPSDSLPLAGGIAPVVVIKILEKGWFRRLSCGATTVLMLTMLTLTKSRGGWIAGSVVLFLILVYYQRYFLWLIPLGLSGMGLLFWRGYLPVLLDMISSSGVISGWQGRLEIWSRAVYMIRDFPFTGIGANTFDLMANTFYPFFRAGPNAEIGHAHNLLLQVAVDLGLPGLIAFLALLIVTFSSAWISIQSYRRGNDNALAALTWAGIASLVGMSVHGMLDATTWIVGRGAFVPFVIIGLLMALANRLKTV